MPLPKSCCKPCSNNKCSKTINKVLPNIAEQVKKKFNKNIIGQYICTSCKFRVNKTLLRTQRIESSIEPESQIINEVLYCSPGTSNIQVNIISCKLF